MAYYRTIEKRNVKMVIAADATFVDRVVQQWFDDNDSGWLCEGTTEGIRVLCILASTDLGKFFLIL